MAKDKIRRNLSDVEMFQGYKEVATFENTPAEEEPAAPVKRRTEPAAKAEDINTAFLTPQLQEQIGKALLELKLQLYKEGVVDYQIKVSRAGRQISLTAVENPKPKNK